MPLGATRSPTPWQPALHRYRDYLANDYLSHARAEPGLTSLPHGAQCYSAIVWSATTIQPNLDSIYAIAVTERVKVGDEILRVGKIVFGPNITLGETLRRARTDSSLVMRDPDSILAAYTAMLDRARKLLPLQFAKTPDAPIVIRAIGKAQAPAAAPAQYSPAPRDGSSPAIFFVNAYQPGGIARMNIGVGASHEGYPGHHFQYVYAAQARAANGAPAVPLERHVSRRVGDLRRAVGRRGRTLRHAAAATGLSDPPARCVHRAADWTSACTRGAGRARKRSTR